MSQKKIAINVTTRQFVTTPYKRYNSVHLKLRRKDFKGRRLKDRSRTNLIVHVTLLLELTHQIPVCASDV